MHVEKLLLAGICLLVSSVHAADSIAPEAGGKPVEIGAATEAILDLQRSQLSAGALHPLRGDVASQAYQRYLESFRQPMPAQGEGTGSTSGKAPVSRK
jgi:hypothetical protein